MINKDKLWKWYSIWNERHLCSSIQTKFKWSIYTTVILLLKYISHKPNQKSDTYNLPHISEVKTNLDLIPYYYIQILGIPNLVALRLIFLNCDSFAPKIEKN